MSEESDDTDEFESEEESLEVAEEAEPEECKGSIGVTERIVFYICCL